MNLKGKALKRALKTNDVYRLSDVPLIQDETVFITPVIAEKMLEKNKQNRPINWNKVELFRKDMENGNWKFHAQGIILDDNGNLLTGQKRLWAIIYSGTSQYMRVSKGSPSNTADLIDRGAPQTNRDLASRRTDRKHSPTEASLVRGIFAIGGDTKPSVDEIAAGLVEYDKMLLDAIEKTRGIKKTKEILMIVSAIIATKKTELYGRVESLGKTLVEGLLPTEVDRCWNRGAAFTLAMQKAWEICHTAK